MQSTISVMAPASFGVPSTLNTGIGWERVRVAILQDLTYSESIKRPVAPLSTIARNLITIEVSVVSSSTLIWSKLGPGVLEMVTEGGRCLSQCG